jgi:sorbitol/mannitol transport system substrate-binding protein
MYRIDLFKKAGLTMPNAPTWDFVLDAAKKLTDKSAGVYGICLRGKAGWGENMAFLTAMANSYGALVRRKVAAAVQHPGMEDDADHLRKPHA